MTGVNENIAFTGLYQNSIKDILIQLDSIIIGKSKQLHLAIACLLARGHLLIEDKPGVGKTTLAHTLAVTLGLPWTRVQFTSDLLPADILGVSIFNDKSNKFEFHNGPVFSSIFLADEINRAPPKAQSALLEAMEERQVSIDGITRALPDPFFVVATQNPSDQMGAYGLPESQLDRFLVGIELGYPDPEAERKLLTGGDRRLQIAELTALTTGHHLQSWQEEVTQVHVADPILDYVQALLSATRTEQSNSHGLSPRAGINLLTLSRAWALIQGREMVLPEDVQSVFPSVAGHRLTGSVQRGAEVANDILNKVAVGLV